MSQLSVLFQQLKERKKWLFYLLMLSLLNSIVFVLITYRIQNKQQQLGVQEIKLENEINSEAEDEVSGFNIQINNLEDSINITPVERTTPTHGRELGIIEQILGNINRFEPPPE